MKQADIRLAMSAAQWVTCSPHEWVWTNDQQVAMARYCMFACHQLGLWQWLTKNACTVQRNSVVGALHWSVLDVDGDMIGEGDTPESAIENAKAKIEG